MKRTPPDTLVLTQHFHGRDPFRLAWVGALYCFTGDATNPDEIPADYVCVRVESSWDSGGGEVRTTWEKS